MANTDSSNIPVTTPESETDESNGMSISRIVMLISIGLIGFVLLILAIGLVISLTAAPTWAPVIQIFRDIFIVIMVVEVILVIGALAILILQIARTGIMLQAEIKPILDNARETTKATRTTAEFVNKNAVGPLIKLKTFFAGLTVFIRELLRINRLLNPKDSTNKAEKDG